MVTKAQREAVLTAPPGSLLDSQVEFTCFGRLPDDATVFPLWSTQWAAALELREMVQGWDAYRQRRFADHLGACIARRLGGGKVDSAQWILLMVPADVARAAVLACMEG